MLVPARQLVAIFFVGFLVSVLSAPALVELTFPAAGDDWPWVVGSVVFYLSLLVGLVGLGRRYQVFPQAILGRLPSRIQALRATLLVIPLLLLSQGTVYVVYYLSFFSAASG